MNKEEYIGTLEIKGTKVDIGSDDYGQQFFFEYEKDGEVKKVGCGAYQFDFIEYICYYLDEKGYYLSMYGKDFWEDKIKYTETVRDIQLKHFPDDKKLKESYESKLYHMRNGDYELYDFNKLYKQLGFER